MNEDVRQGGRTTAGEGCELRRVAQPSVAAGPYGITVRSRLKRLTGADERVLQAVGVHLVRQRPVMSRPIA